METNKRALLVGIDHYQNLPQLTGCVADARCMRDPLERNADGSERVLIRKEGRDLTGLLIMFCRLRRIPLPKIGLKRIDMVDGNVALVEANPSEFKELARLPALHGKTWNNPVLSGTYLLLRNDQEAVCYQVPVREAKD